MQLSQAGRYLFSILTFRNAIARLADCISTQGVDLPLCGGMSNEQSRVCMISAWLCRWQGVAHQETAISVMWIRSATWFSCMHEIAALYLGQAFHPNKVQLSLDIFWHFYFTLRGQVRILNNTGISVTYTGRNLVGVRCGEAPKKLKTAS